MNKAGLNYGVDLLIENFSITMETLLMLGEDMILNEMMFGGDINQVWNQLHSMKAQSLHFMKIVWGYKTQA